MLHSTKFLPYAFSENVPSSGKLALPELPKKDDYFEVRVPFAVNPYNFFVQPLQSQRELNMMMAELQQRYKSIEYSPLIAEQVIPGNIYASKHEDGNWYRYIHKAFSMFFLMIKYETDT